jgi:hypothetical protein
MKVFLALALVAFPENAFSFSTTPRLSMTQTKVSTVRRLAQSEEKTRTGIFSEDVKQEAKDALESVGWARPSDDAEMTSEDPFVLQINAGIQRDFGVGLDDLLNPAKVTFINICCTEPISGQ